jgi:hypothetical protein
MKSSKRSPPLNPKQCMDWMNLLSGLLILFVTVGVHAGNGASYSGGGEAIGGDAIPSQTENSLPYARILEANNLCLQDLSISIWNQLFKTNYLEAHSSQIQYSKDLNGRVQAFLPQQLYSVSLNKTNEESCRSRVNLLSLPRTLTLEFSWCKSEPVIIEASSGSPFQVTRLVLRQGVSFVNVEKARFHVVQGDQALLDEKLQPTGLSVDMDAFTQCLRSRLRP